MQTQTAISSFSITLILFYFGININIINNKYFLNIFELFIGIRHFWFFVFLMIVDKLWPAHSKSLIKLIQGSS